MTRIYFSLGPSRASLRSQTRRVRKGRASYRPPRKQFDLPPSLAVEAVYFSRNAVRWCGFTPLRRTREPSLYISLAVTDLPINRRSDLCAWGLAVDQELKAARNVSTNCLNRKYPPWFYAGQSRGSCDRR